MMSSHDRTREETDAATGQKIITTEGPAEIASWFFPQEEADEQRDALRKAIENLLDKRIADVIGTADIAQQSPHPTRSIDHAWRNYLEAVPAVDTSFDHHEDRRSAFYGGALSALLAIDEVLEPAEYVERPK